MSEVARNLRRVQERIRAAAERSGRDPQDVKLVVVTKTVPPDRIREAIEAGATILGENYVQEARRKIAELGHPVSWHLIGHLQTNKAKQAVELFEMIHSVDSLRVARELDRRAGRARHVHGRAGREAHPARRPGDPRLSKGSPPNSWYGDCTSHRGESRLEEARVFH